ncbi:MAG: ParB/RepB/Spo0J family partition protein, partial [Oscillospiraceae bacterium]
MGVKSAFKIKTINRVVGIEIEMIQPNKNQPRKIFLQKELESLADSIKENGLLQPITVRKQDKEYYELVSGERRLRASKIAGMKVIPCIVINSTQKQSAVFALLENLQRSDLNYFEEALAIKSLMVEWGLSQAELGLKLGYAQPTIANKLRLLRFDDMTQKLMIGKGINERQARALLKIEDENKLFEAIDYIHSNKLSA